MDFDTPQIASPGLQKDGRVPQTSLDGQFSTAGLSDGTDDWREALPQGPGDIGPGVGINTMKVIYFNYDSFEVRPDQLSAIEYNADWILRNPEFQIRLEGHCDERGTEEYNIGLGDRRARAVKKHLVYLGVDPARLVPISFGEMRPAEPGYNEHAWSRNRRVELWISRMY